MYSDGSLRAEIGSISSRADTLHTEENRHQADNLFKNGGNDAIVRMISDKSPWGLYCADHRTDRILYCNDSFLRIWSLGRLRDPISRAEIGCSEIFRHMAQLVIDVPAFTGLFSRIPIANEAEGFESHIRLVDGRIIRHFTSPVEYVDGRYMGRVYVFEDITTVMKVREDAKKSEERYKELVGLLPQIVFEMDTELNLTFANRSAFEEMGYTDDDFIRGLNAFELIAPEDRERAVRNLQRVMNGEKCGEEYVFQRKDGSLFSGITYSSAIYRDEKPSGIRGIVVNITERKQAEERLRTLSAAIEQSPSSIIVFDMDGNIVYVNPMFSQITGYPAEKAVGRKLFDLYFANARPEQLGEIAVAIRSGNAWWGEIEYIRNNGKSSWISAHISPIKDESGRITHYIDIEEDITDRKLADKEFRKLFMALDQSPNSITIADSDGMISYVNPSFTRLTGVRREDVIGKRKIDLVSENAQSRIGSIMEHVKAGNEWRGERRFVTKDGKERWISVQISPLRDVSGRVAHYIITESDITGRKQAEEQLRTLSAAVEQSPASVKIIGVDRRITYVNPKFSEMSGYVRDEVVGQLNGIMPVGVFDPVKIPQLLEAVRSGKDWMGELQYMKKSGGAFWVESHVSPIKDENGVIQSYMEISEDITDRKLADERLRNSLREKEVLLKEVHHRVKNNMQIISSLLNLQLSGIDQEPVRQILTESQNRIRSIALVHERMYMSDDLARIDFLEYMKSLGSRLLQSYAISSRHVDLAIDGDPVFLGVDQAVPCGLIVNELISNSLKHAFLGRSNGIIRIRMQSGAQNMIIIEDDGAGVPDGFTVAEARSMGMQLVSALAGQLDGTIALERINGTRFMITFPAR
ncbi:MAG TPA: PAS domain S-box protein [Methanocella sp.]|nr:PAS domain S-box protein [Methanocella sp.]